MSDFATQIKNGLRATADGWLAIRRLVLAAKAKNDGIDPVPGVLIRADDEIEAVGRLLQAMNTDQSQSLAAPGTIVIGGMTFHGEFYALRWLDELAKGCQASDIEAVTRVMAQINDATGSFAPRITRHRGKEKPRARRYGGWGCGRA